MNKECCYVEKHHIIPKSEGGDNSSDNLVNLTAREHYIAHLLLYKIYKDNKMLYALWQMTHCTDNENRCYGVNSRLYETLRKKFSEAHRQNMSGEKNPRYGTHHSEETKRLLSASKLGNTYCLGRKLSKDTKRKIGEKSKGRHFKMPDWYVEKLRQRMIGNKVWLGKKHSEDTKRKMSEAHKGKKIKPLSEEHKRKLSEALKGKPKSAETKLKMSEARKEYWANKKKQVKM